MPVKTDLIGIATLWTWQRKWTHQLGELQLSRFCHIPQMTTEGFRQQLKEIKKIVSLKFCNTCLNYDAIGHEVKISAWSVLVSLLYHDVHKQQKPNVAFKQTQHVQNWVLEIASERWKGVKQYVQMIKSKSWHKCRDTLLDTHISVMFCDSWSLRCQKVSTCSVVR